MICIDPEGSTCISEDELAVQLEEWEGSDDKQDPPSASAVEDLLLFESKTSSGLASVLQLYWVALVEMMLIQVYF